MNIRCILLIIILFMLSLSVKAEIKVKHYNHKDGLNEYVYDIRQDRYGGKGFEAKHLQESGMPSGIIDSQEDVGGWPMLNSLPAPKDTDHDGMPDEWERQNGLNPNDPSDRNGITADGYTNLEVCLNGIG